MRLSAEVWSASAADGMIPMRLLREPLALERKEAPVVVVDSAAVAARMRLSSEAVVADLWA